MKPLKWTIYCHIHIESGRKYTGLTKHSMAKRWNRHAYDAIKFRYLNNYFHNAIRKYGKDAFEHKILRVCYSLEEANAAEIEYIAKYDTTNPEKGFNLKKGGAHTPHPVKNPMERPEFRANCISI